jgi:glycosyltransferase involved in cell wall biosynthesis
MKILMVSNNYYPYTGGVARSVDVTMKMLKEQGHDVKLITYDFTGNAILEPDIVRVRCPLRFKYRGKIIPISWGAERLIRQYVGEYKPDIIHIHHPFLLGIYALHAAWKHSIPVIFTHHTMYENYIHYMPCAHRFIRWYLPFYMCMFYKRLSGIIAPSQAVHRHIEVLTNKPCEVIPSSVDPLYINAPSTKDLFDHNRPLRLMTASRLVPEKNIEQLLYAASLLKIPFQFVICGDGYIRKRLEHLAYQEYKFSPENIVFKGELDSQELAQQYRSADIFIFASQSETQGLVIGEAMACGTPVIAFRGPGVEDALAHGGGVLVNTVEEMASIIENLYDDFQQLTILRQESHHYAQQFYPEQCISNIINFYKIVAQK